MLAAAAATVTAWLGWLLGRLARRPRPAEGRADCVACWDMREAAREGRVHVSPSGRLVTLVPPPPAILETCLWCGAHLVAYLESGHWVLTDAGRAHAEMVRAAEERRRTCS